MKFLPCLFLASFLASPLFGANYYVATGGNDSAAGSQSAPWKTIAKAVGAAKAGDTVNFGSGTWYENVHLAASGTASAPITLKGAANYGSVLEGGFYFDGDYWVVDGFLKSGAQACPFWWPTWGNHEVVKNVKFDGKKKSLKTQVCIPKGNYNWIDHCTFFNWVDADLFNLFGQYNTISNCEIYGDTNPDVNAIHSDFVQIFGSGDANTHWNCNHNYIVGNYMHDTEEQIGNITNDNDPTVSDYYFFNNVFANLGTSLFLGAPNSHVFNNIFYKAGQWQGGPVVGYQCGLRDATGSKFQNNVLIDSGTVVYSCGGAPSVDHNFYTSATNGQVSGNLGTNATNGGDPRLVNIPTDFHSTSGTPYRGLGVTLTYATPGIPAGLSVSSDKDGVSRGSKWDYGSYQFGGGAPSPTPSATPTPTPSVTPTPTPAGPKFRIGDWLTPTVLVNVRATAGGAVLGTHVPPDKGQVKDGPTDADLNGETVHWYNIDWQTSPKGWVGDDNLVATAAPTPSPTPRPSVTPSPTPPASCSYTQWDAELHQEFTKCPTPAELGQWLESNPPKLDP